MKVCHQSSMTLPERERHHCRARYAQKLAAPCAGQAKQPWRVLHDVNATTGKFAQTIRRWLVDALDHTPQVWEF